MCDKGVGAALFMALFRSLIRIFSGQTALNGLPLTCCAAVQQHIGTADQFDDITMLAVRRTP